MWEIFFYWWQVACCVIIVKYSFIDDRLHVVSLLWNTLLLMTGCMSCHNCEILFYWWQVACRVIIVKYCFIDDRLHVVSSFWQSTSRCEVTAINEQISLGLWNILMSYDGWLWVMLLIVSVISQRIEMFEVKFQVKFESFQVSLENWVVYAMLLSWLTLTYCAHLSHANWLYESCTWKYGKVWYLSDSPIVIMPRGVCFCYKEFFSIRKPERECILVVSLTDVENGVQLSFDRA